MQTLIPLEFVALGWAQFAWLALAFGGLSLLARDWSGRRIGGAVAVGGVLFLFGLLRWGALPDDAALWNKLGPVLVLPPFGAALVLVGRLRLGRGWMIWLGALVGLSALGPFDNSFWEWAFLGVIGVLWAALFDREGPVRAMIGGRLQWLAFGAFFAVLCHMAVPFGISHKGAFAILFLAWLIHAIDEQGKTMRKYVVRRLFGAPVVLLLLLILSFVLIRSAPGGPFDKDKRVDPAIKELQEAKYGYDKPWPVQIRIYLVRLIWEGDLGDSTKQKGKTVNDIIGVHIGPTTTLGLAAIALALLIGITAGLISGIRQNSIFDYASMTGAMIGLALPTFVVGPMLVLVFALKLGWFQVSGWEEFPRDLILPAITLALPFAARIARLTRAGMLEVVNQDYIRTARAKGLSEPVIVLRHTLKGTLLPVVSFLGPAIAQLLTGSLVVEMIFGVPGMGREFVQSALNRDYDLALGLVVLFGSLLIVFNLVVDVIYGFLDPRIRHA